MKNYLSASCLMLIVLMFACNDIEKSPEDTIVGKWRIVDIYNPSEPFRDIDDTTSIGFFNDKSKKYMGFAFLLLLDYDYFEYTDDNKVYIVNKKNQFLDSATYTVLKDSLLVGKEYEKENNDSVSLIESDTAVL